MDCGPRRSAICNGTRLSWTRAACTSAGPRTARHPSILSGAMRFVPYVSSAVIARTGLTSLSQNAGFHHLIQRLGKAARMPFPLHPHMLRHACGYKLANDGHDTRALQHYLGHKNIQHTVRYTELSPDRFRDFWRD